MRRSERGAVSTFVAVIALAFLAAAGLAIDGGRKVNALGEASDLADNAARAGAQAVDLDTLRSTGQLVLHSAQAQQEAQDYLAALGQVAQSITVADDTISVTVAVTVDPVLLPTGAITVSATESATAITEEP